MLTIHLCARFLRKKHLISASIVRLWHCCLFCYAHFLPCAFYVSFHVTVGLHGCDGPFPLYRRYWLLQITDRVV